MDECFKRLEDLTGSEEGKTGSLGKLNPTLKLQAIQRLLILVQRYITTVEVRVRVGAPVHITSVVVKDCMNTVGIYGETPFDLGNVCCLEGM